jgi:DNA-binding IclR family transcriptional regulator
MTSDTTTPRPLAEPMRKTCELFRLLAGHELLGLSPSEIAKGLEVGAPWVSVNLPALATTGFVERVADTNRWRLGVSFVRIAFAVQTHHQQATHQLQELGQRYAVPPLSK